MRLKSVINIFQEKNWISQKCCCFLHQFNNLSTFFCSDPTDYCKIMHFRNKTNFFPTYCWSVLISLFCLYVFLRALFCSSAIMTLRIVWYLDICIGSHLAFHQIIWYNKRIHSHGLKITSCYLFFGGFFIFRGI